MTMDDGDIERLERELPALSRVKRFTKTLAGIPWFANLGEPLTAGANAAARRFVEGLGFPGAEVAILVDWDDAAAAAESLDWQSPAWEAEELLRADLTTRALSLLSEEALQISMTLIAAQVAEPAREGMEQAAVIFDFDSEDGKQLAVGAAVQAAHQAALTLIAAHDPSFDAEDHPFAAKFRLFEFGRWPVGVVGSSFNLF
ncbi:MAG: hypothetical protein HXY23_02880 [Parvularculaceae bacterium]|nr:hypothetical protein [Parvularculaceae bacterium]